MTTDDLKAIGALHQRDMDAAKAQDFERLRELWTEDCVIIPPQGPIQHGTASLGTNRSPQENDIEILEYIEEFEEVEILGNVAYEWGIIRGKSRVASGEVQDSLYRVMRILKKVDGDWKIHRSIWTGNIS
ncbi:MAG: nuclear transport factor 2 family protein [Chloroflexi bacterium]|nr:nuclear transport factor 2 family protein [Chloroflexota bacterium]